MNTSELKYIIEDTIEDTRRDIDIMLLQTRMTALERQLAQMQAILDRLDAYARSNPEQVDFEAKYHAGRCRCVQCEERKQEVQA